jgi:DNA-binding LytR/AlgR family response regulator
MMNILIVEDEALAADRLEKILKEITPDITVLAKLGSIKESVKWLMLNTADLIFLDIQLSDGLSFSIFEQVTIQTPVIFTTAYDQYAIKAFQLNSVSYLLKPLRKNELAESLQKYKSLKSAFSIDFDSLLSAIQGNKPEYRKRFLIQIADKFRKVEIEEIAYFYAFDKGVYLATFDGHSYPVDISLDNLENIIDPSQFFRINRRYVVSMKSIANMFAWSRSRIKLVLKPPTEDEMETIVSIDRTADFKKWMNK